MQRTPELTFDGCGINGSDEYRTRIATFSNDAEHYGPLFASAPELLEALKEAEGVIRWAVQESEGRVKSEIVGGWLYHADKARSAIAKATGSNGGGL